MDIESMSSAFKGHEFSYAPMVKVDEENRTTVTRHCIKVLLGDGRRHFLGSAGELIEYDSEAAARSDIEKLNAWARS